MPRLFTGLEIPAEIGHTLSSLRGGLPGARWVPPENLHITLRFLGEVDGRDADYVDAALASIRAPGFQLRLAGVGHFASGNRVKTVWAGVDKEPALLIGMDMLGVLERLVIDYRRNEVSMYGDRAPSRLVQR